VDLRLPDGRSLQVHDTGPIAPDRLALVWHNASPHTGALLEPVRAAAAHRGVRVITYARPSYGESTPHPDRTVGSVGQDVAQIVDALSVERFAVVGHSGGGPPALACAATMPDRVLGVVSIAGPAPYTSDFDWYAGMQSDTALRAAAQGRGPRAALAETEEFDPACFTAADYTALEAEWAAMGEDAGRAGQAGPHGLIDDDVAMATPWGFPLSAVIAPVLLIHGEQDRVIPVSHSRWLLRRLSNAQLWLRPRDGHISVLRAVPVAMDWLLAGG
jgi:pimeloyl-ACP methyl ester carboxylesterase